MALNMQINKPHDKEMTVEEAQGMAEALVVSDEEMARQMQEDIEMMEKEDI